MTLPPQDLKKFSSLVEVVEALRGPDGCPWDKEQTPLTLTQYAIEEAHELVEAIESGDQAEVVEELGDCLLQVVLHAEIARQENRFDIHDVIATLNDKMIRRHPHVFGDVKAETSAEVLKNWQVIKAQEKEAKKKTRKDFGVPVGLPALQRAQKIGAKTAKLNFDWDHSDQVMEKIQEELAEVKAAVKSRNPKAIEGEIGDLLFSVAQYARHLGIDPEQALRGTNRRFETRFFKMQAIAEKDGAELTALPKEKLEELWQRVKKTEKV